MIDRRCLGRALLLLLLLTIVLPSRARAEAAPTEMPTGGPVAFTYGAGHHLVGAFLTVWRARGGLATFGYPLSEPVRDSAGRWAQVTERALLTLPVGVSPMPVSNAGLVSLEALGRDLTAGRTRERPFLPVVAPFASSALWFAATGHTLAHGFQTHWLAHEGAVTLGLPISEEFREDGQIVQWFERGRLEFNPATAALARTAVGRLAPRASRLIGAPVSPASNAAILEALPPLPAPARLADWSAAGFGLNEAAAGVLLPVGHDRPLASDILPADLMLARESGLTSGLATMRGLLLTDLQEMAAAAHARDLALSVVSGYRSFDYQRSLIEREVRQAGLHGIDEETARRTAMRSLAQPGESEHHLGTAIDFNRLEADFGGTPTGRFLIDEGWRYGFLLSYPAGAEERTGYVYEPWHLRWVGRTLAAAIHTDGYLANGAWLPEQPTLEEYLESVSLLLPPPAPPLASSGAAAA